MTTPSGQISAQDIKNEFGEVSGTVPLGSYRVSQTKGELTLAIGDGVPTSGAISFDNMRNKRLNIVVDYYGDNANLNRAANGDNTMNAKTRYNDQNERVSVIGGLKSKPSNTAPHRVRIHVNQNIGGKSGEINTVALRTGSWNSGTDLIVDVGGEGAIYGAGGDGKSMSAWTMAKHIATGDPFLVRGSKVPVDKGTVLLLNGDQPLSQLKEQLEEVNLPVTSNVKIQTDWQLQRYAQFIKLMQEHTPKLVVIDSLIGCSGGRAFDENKSDFAQPLYWLTRNNGVLFPKTTILIIHHANKNGGFRGTSAIRDAETWKLSKPTQEQVNKVGRSSRFITIEKSRSGRMGTQMVMKMNDDLTFSIADYTPEVSNDSESPTTVQDKVLQKLRKIHPETYTINQMIHDPMVDGKDAAIRKSFQRLIKKGLIELIEDEESNKSYKAILACGEGTYLVPLKES